MVEVTSPSSEKMDISETSDPSSHENTNTSQILRLSNPISSEILDNEILDNKKYDNTVIMEGNISSTKNATNSHPLMYSPTSPISPDFPDLIPEKPKTKHTNYEKQNFNPQAHSTAFENSAISQELLENHFNIDLPIDEYNEKLPG
ncbi:hypothetical protein NQ314_006371 [Rhamnusium bicolor]|uniref:Uncharacterized protein n=1 Tax=Rhamnusium bicolor TaxID=1586634 RepID=A0AAV8Z4C4_9CUCU|nr:hypothetical protein NQ314_006371 [Rhamnusium bicolor]